MKLDFMTNIKINKISETYYTVTATTERFGKNQIMFEGISEQECKNYIKRESVIRVRVKGIDDTSWMIKRSPNRHYSIAVCKDGYGPSKFKRTTKSKIEKMF